MHRYCYPKVIEIRTPRETAPVAEPPRFTQRELVTASLLRRPGAHAKPQAR